MYRVRTAVDGIGLLVGDLNAELLLQVRTIISFPKARQQSIYLLNGHHDLNGIQAVKTEVICEVGAGVDLEFGEKR